MTQPPPPPPDERTPHARPSPHAPAWQPASGSEAPRRRDGVGVAALAVAVVLVAFELGMRFAFSSLIGSPDAAAQIGMLNAVSVGVHVVLAIVALGLGIVGLVLPRRPRGMAGAAVGIAAVDLLLVLTSQLQQLLW